MTSLRRRLGRQLHAGPNPLVGYLLATAGVVVALGITWLFRSYLEHSIFIVFWAVVFFASLVGGLGPGLLTSVFSVLLVDWFFIPPAGSLRPADIEDLAPLFLFVLLSYAVSSLTARNVLERRRSEAAEQELSRQIEVMQTQATELEMHAEQASSLAAELAEANEHLEWLRARADQANRAKSDFLARMSHDLRTPLNAIAGHAELIAMGIHGPTTEAQRDALGRIAASQRYLLELISDILDFSKLEAGALRLQLAAVDLCDVLREMESLVGPQYRAKGVEFGVVPSADPVPIQADRSRVAQICANLLTNALKATPPGGRVSLHCRTDGDHGVMEVHDTGVGIPADRVPEIFDPFTQVGRSLSSPREGVGLGLAIARELARAMGGDIAVETVEGEGSRFLVRFPLAHSGRPATLEREPEP